MKLFHISQYTNTGYDIYSDAVVAALDENEAKTIHPCSGRWNDPPKDAYVWSPKNLAYEWAPTPDQVSVTLIGEAVDGMEAGVICASFHAG